MKVMAVPLLPARPEGCRHMLCQCAGNGSTNLCLIINSEWETLRLQHTHLPNEGNGGTRIACPA